MMRVGKTVNLGYKRLYAILPVSKDFLETLINPSDKYQKSMYEQPPRIKNPTESNEFYDLY